MKFKMGDKVIVNGDLYSSSTAVKPTGSVSNKVTYITRISKNTPHPYNTTGDLGWMNEKDIRFYEDPTPIYECEIELTDKDGLIDYLKTHKEKIVMIDSEELKKVLGL